MKFLIIGPQGSGKGTQADLLAEKLGIPHLSSGALLREEKRTGSTLGKEIAALIDHGKFVPDAMIWEMIRHRLDEHKDWILDGFPRTLHQAELLDQYAPPEKVILLDVPDEVCVERISGRRMCTICGREYHLIYHPPKTPGICDLDGGKLVQRADDREDVVRRRLAEYHEKTVPLLDHYRSILVVVNGDQSIQAVWQEIQQKLGI